jgi:hypothetical protein
MWINTSRELLLSAVDACKRCQQDSLAAALQRAIDEATPGPDDPSFIETARILYARHGGDVEVDDDAVLSRADAGAFVMGWLWVSHKEVEVTIKEVTDGQGD